MKLSHEEIAARLAASPEHDVCVLRIEEGDFGCEEHLGLAEGYTCCFADLHP